MLGEGFYYFSFPCGRQAFGDERAGLGIPPCRTHGLDAVILLDQAVVRTYSRYFRVYRFLAAATIATDSNAEDIFGHGQLLQYRDAYLGVWGKGSVVWA